MLGRKRLVAWPAEALRRVFDAHALPWQPQGVNGATLLDLAVEDLAEVGLSKESAKTMYEILHRKSLNNMAIQPEPTAGRGQGISGSVG